MHGDICLIIFEAHINFLLIEKMKILVLIDEVVRLVSPMMLIIETKMVSIFLECSPFSTETRVFLVSILRSESTHSSVFKFFSLIRSCSIQLWGFFFFKFFVMGFCLVDNDYIGCLFCILMLVLFSIFVSFRHARFFPSSLK